MITRPNGKIYYYVYLSYKDPETNMWKTKGVSTGIEGKGKKRLAKQQIPEIMEKYAYLEQKGANSTPVPLDVKINEYLDYWVETKKSHIEKSTYEGYCLRLRGLKDYFRMHGNPQMNLITAKDVDELFRYLLMYGKRNQKTGAKEPLSVRSVRDKKNLLNAAFDQGIIDGIVKYNPVSSVRVHGHRNKDYSKDMLFMTEEESAQLLRFLSSPDRPNFHRLVPIVFIGIYMGLRRSEILGLKWNAIDFKKGTMTIQHTVVRVTTIEAKNRTKTRESHRTLSLFPTALKCLEQVRKEYEHNKEYWGDGYLNDEGYVFSWEDGRPYDPDYISHLFKKAMTQFGRPEITLHKLRHTCASMLINRGWDVKKLQYWLGHSDTMTTLNIYAHFNRERMNDTPDDLEAISSGSADLFVS